MLRKLYFWRHFPHGHGFILCLVQLGRSRDMGKNVTLLAGNCALFCNIPHTGWRHAQVACRVDGQKMGGVACRRGSGMGKLVARRADEQGGSRVDRRGGGVGLVAWHFVGVSLAGRAVGEGKNGREGGEWGP